MPAAILGLAVALVGCGPRTLVDRVQVARGPAITAAARASTVEVLAGYPGTWQSRMTFAAPERYAWSYDTTADPYHYLFDGTVVRSFVGSAMVAEDGSPTAPLRSHARLTAAMLLAWPRDGSVVTTPEPPAADGRRTIVVTWPDGGAYRIAVDAADRVTAVEGALTFPGVGSGTVRAELSDYRAVGRRQLPFHIRYVLADRPFADERVGTWCPELGELSAETFSAPARLPTCP